MFTRHLQQSLQAALADTPATLLVGARQTGKSTLCESVAVGEHRARYLTFDDAAVLAAARADPGGFVAGLDTPVVLDEIQRAPELFPALKLAVDRRRQPGRFLLTGSANVLMLPRVAESLAGRMEVLTLWPLSQGEIGGVREGFIDAVFAAALSLPKSPGLSRSEILGRALRGGYPEPLQRSDPRRRRAWFGSYITTILQRDVRDISNIEGLAALPRLLTILGARAASLLNYAELSRSAAMPQSTLKRYIDLLEATFLIRIVPAWSSNRAKRLMKTPRLLLTDTGLLAYLTGLTEARLEEDTNLAGALLENFVAMELTKQASWSEIHPEICHYRTLAGQEVDLVLEGDDGRIVGVEVKASAAIGTGDFKGLASLREASGRRFHRGIVLYTGTEALPFGDKLYALPISALWQLQKK
jgi:predicted AAA+ superfamily ATPase